MNYFLLLLLCLTKTSLTQEENSEHVHLIATPLNFTLGLTPELKIACRFRKEDFPRMSAVSSVVLYSSLSTDKPEYNYIASVSIFDGLTNELTDTANIKGEVNSKNVSFLELQFKYPMKDAAGIYLCEVHGMERFGKSITLYNTAVVKGLMPDMFDIVDIIRDLKISNEDLLRDSKFNVNKSENMEKET